jgi:hypothetical protein
VQRRLLGLEALACHEHPAVRHSAEDDACHVAICELDRRKQRLARLRPGQLARVYLLRVGRHRPIRQERNVEDAAVIALRAAARNARPRLAAPSWQKQERDRLLATTEQIAVNLVEQAARQCHVHARAQQDENQPEDEHIPAHQAPPDTGEQALEPAHPELVEG